MMNKYVILLSLAILASFGGCTSTPSKTPIPGFGFAEYKDMMHGFLLGIHVEEQYTDHLLSCLTDQKHLEVKFVEIMDKIDKLDFKNLPLTAQLFVDLYDGIIMSIVEIDLCADPNERYDHLFQMIYHLMPSTIIKRLMLNFISNPQQIFKDIQDAVDNYLNGKFQQVGKDLGDIMFMVLIYRVNAPTINLEDYIKVIKGLLKGMNINHDVDEILKCVGKVPDVITEIVHAIETLKHLDFRHLNELVEAIMKIFAGIKHILNDLAACANTVTELKEIVKKLSGLTIEKVIKKVTANLMYIIRDVTEAKTAWESKEFEKFGQALGDIIYKVLLDPKLADY